eukprot:EC721473.1.p2 GENE.EC721473.1~~EC721473.1.p2  ORF type:complete len:145 (+),score=38.92 EC721473.1:37-471(+)
MPLTTNEETLRKIVECWNHTRNPAEMEKFYEKDVECEFSLLGPVSGLQKYMEAQKAWHTVLNPFNMSTCMQQGPGPNDVTLHWSVRGRFVAPFGEIQPHNKFMTVTGISVFTFNAHGRVVAERIYFDGATTVKKFKGEIEEDQY